MNIANKEKEKVTKEPFQKQRKITRNTDKKR